MSSTTVFHLGITKGDLQGAELAIVPGDPARSERIAREMGNPAQLCSTREFNSWLGWISGKPVVVCSTGIGGPSTSIAVEELSQLGVTTFLRIGTTGAIQADLEPGDMIVTSGSVRLDGASTHFAPIEFPAVANFECTQALVEAVKAEKVNYHVGITASSDTFYPGQERYDTRTGHVIRQFRGSMEEWQALGVLNYEMESATLLTMCAAMGLRAGCVAAAIVNRTRQEIPDESRIAESEATAIRVVVNAASRLLNS
ncbi:MAG: uridine phosphorylase [Endozoicomonas sp.]